MKVYLIAGEASGDLHGSNLIHELKKNHSNLEMRGWGGDLMEDQGMTLVKHYRELAFMGFVEVVRNIRTIARNLKNCKSDIENFKPDLLILIDYPGFNLRIAEFAKKLNIPVYYYISPQVWAWKENRVKKIKRTVDRMYVILPFEKDFYKKHNFEVEYLGHPLVDVIPERENTEAEFKEFVEKNRLPDAPIIALVPGSRKQEIEKMLPVMSKVKKAFPDYQLVVAGAPNIEADFYRNISSDVRVVAGQTHQLYRVSKAGLVTSGTATLEAALSGMPQVVCYKANALSVMIARRLIKVPFISLVNLIAGKELVKELIQGDFTPTKLISELKLLLSDEGRIKIQSEYREMRLKLGESGTSEKIAKDMLKSISTEQ